MNSKRNLIILILAIAIMSIIIYLPLDVNTDLTNQGKVSLGVLAFAIILWMTEAVPFPVSGLTLIILVPLFGLLSFEEAVYSGFGNPIIVFFIGIMLMAAALTESGFTQKMTFFVLAKIGTKTSTLLLIFLIIGSALSMWITNMGVAAILLPIGMKILEESNREPLESNFGKGLMISIAWGCGIGGMGTPVGNGANVLAIGFLNNMANIQISFIDWMRFGVPAVLILLPISWLIIKFIFPPEIEYLEFDRDYFKEELNKLGKLTKEEIFTLIILTSAILLWLIDPILDSLLGLSIPIQAVAICAGVVMFIPHIIDIISWEKAEESIDWGAIILIAGGLSLGESLIKTGGVNWLARILFSRIGTLNIVSRLILIVTIILFLKILFASNTATGLVVIPIMIVLAQDLNLNIWQIVGPAALAISLAFILVPSSPTNVIPYGAGYFSLKDFAFSGIFISIAGILTISFVFLMLL